jgi:hypothetical protein
VVWYDGLENFEKGLLIANTYIEAFEGEIFGNAREPSVVTPETAARGME